MERIRSRGIKLIFNSKGEMLIETMLAFVLLLIAIVAVTMLVFSANSLNMNSSLDSYKMEEAIENIESGKGGSILGDGNLKISLNGETINVPIEVKEQEGIIYFNAK